jgi:hypothetical protein
MKKKFITIKLSFFMRIEENFYRDKLKTAD